jgi:hypothetical protein
MPWQSIGYVTSGLTLVAFIVAAAIWAYRRTLLQKERLIRQAPESDRGRLVENALEFFDVDTSGLTKNEKYQLAVQQIKERAIRYKINAFVIVTIAFLATGVSIFALWRSSNNPEPGSMPGPVTTKPTTGNYLDVSGEWSGIATDNDDNDKWLYKLSLSQNQNRVDGKVSISELSGERYAVYELQGQVNGNKLYYAGTKFIRQSGTWCLATVNLHYSLVEGRPTLTGTWGPNNNDEGGCDQFAYGNVKISK